MSDHEMSDDDAPNATPEAFLRLMALLHERERRINTNEELVEHLKSQGVLSSQRIVDAFLNVPRGDFIPPEQIRSGYNDSPLPLQKWGFNVSAPHVYAMCLEALNPLPGMVFLDIGSGCGHLTTLAAFLVGPSGKALGLDIRDDVIEFSRQNTRHCMEKQQLQLDIEFENRNCFIPDIEERTFDRIHSGACCPEKFLKRLVALLKPGGILVTPSGNELLKITKKEEGEGYDEKVLSNVRYGDLVLPSNAEIEVALFLNARKKAKIIQVAPSTYEKVRHSFQHLEKEIRESLEKKFSSTPSTDISFVVGKEIFHAHRLVVGKRCDHFGALFKSGMKDADGKEISIIPQCEPSAFQEFLRYLYTDQLEITPDNAVDLLELSSFYQVNHLIGLCELFLKQGVDLENSCELLELADRHSSFQLKRFCISFIIDHFEEVRETEAFQKLPRDLLIDVTSLACRQLVQAFSHPKMD